MPRFVSTLVLFGCMSGATLTGTSAAAGNSELSRCLDASTVLGAGGDVSDQELKAAQSTCARLQQSSPDKNTLARVNAAAETIAEEIQLRAASR